MRFSTRLLHGGWTSDEKTGATNSPIYLAEDFAAALSLI